MSTDRRGAVPEEMDKFASAQASRLLGKLVFQVRHTAKHPNEQAIHDLRVSIRRLSQCLREFHQFFPRHETKKILKGSRETLTPFGSRDARQRRVVHKDRSG